MTTTFADLGLDPMAIERALNAGMTFPAAWYSDPAMHRLELTEIFRRSWQVVCFEARVAEPGDHAVSTVGDVPVIIVRGEDRILRGFINVCRHRAFPLASCDGNRRSLQCRYHAWTYDLEGRLRAAPRSDGEPGFDRDQFGLLPISVECLGGFVWAHPDPMAAPLAVEHPSLPDLIAEWGLDATPFEVAGQRDRFDVPANWKVFVENASECYHCATVHKASFGDAYDVSREAYQYINRDRLMGQLANPNRNAREFTGGSGSYRFVYVWPGSMLEFDGDLRASWMTVRPTGPDRCRVEFDSSARAGADPAIVASWDELYRRTNEEDNEVVALQQPNLTSCAVPYGRLMPNAEASIAHFHRVVFAEMRKVMG